ncbi:5-hydroxytryptamine receptor 3E-like isoform X2 [Oryzias latipes]
MMIQALFFPFVLTGETTSNPNLHDHEDNQFTSNRTSDLVLETHFGAFLYECSWEFILKKFDLRENNEKYTVGRPVEDHHNVTFVDIEMDIFAILDVRETDQMLVSYIWVYWRWNNEHIHWDPDQFCEQANILVPTKFLWMPDLTIEEMTDRDKTAPSSLLKIRHDGWVEYRDGQVVDTSCSLDITHFPFDYQFCDISFKSIMHSDEELLLVNNRNKTESYEEIIETIKTTANWRVCSLKVNTKSVDYFGYNQTKIVYTITLKRHSQQYVANFVLPLLFFVCLDIASLLLSETGGEKIGFKVTILLSVTVMQFILNDILPPSSDKIPFIVMFCVWIFTMMLLSLLVTIFVRYLIDKDQTCKVNKKHSRLQCCCTAEDAAKEDPSFPKEDCSDPKSEVFLVMERVSEELSEMRKSITLLSNRTEDEKPGCWSRVADIINKVFTVAYITTVIMFIKIFFEEWIYEHPYVKCHRDFPVSPNKQNISI